jgi:hypothetical protein
VPKLGKSFQVEEMSLPSLHAAYLNDYGFTIVHAKLTSKAYSFRFRDRNGRGHRPIDHLCGNARVDAMGCCSREETIREY